ncbi:hypothetical protein L6452_17415 [Arctium lappa]|uniref:Uncharacterized protein n=1 Tax=Arctium lappa TaxID=4217 RepID=A0ACB9C3E8_ARCLA|nr:hypothetical protein L6452_17415 [Arctium lappa]
MEASGPPSVSKVQSTWKQPDLDKGTQSHRAMIKGSGSKIDPKDATAWCYPVINHDGAEKEDFEERFEASHTEEEVDGGLKIGNSSSRNGKKAVVDNQTEKEIQNTMVIGIKDGF